MTMGLATKWIKDADQWIQNKNKNLTTSSKLCIFESKSKYRNTKSYKSICLQNLKTILVFKVISLSVSTFILMAEIYLRF